MAFAATHHPEIIKHSDNRAVSNELIEASHSLVDDADLSKRHNIYNYDFSESISSSIKSFLPHVEISGSQIKPFETLHQTPQSERQLTSLIRSDLGIENNKLVDGYFDKFNERVRVGQVPKSEQIATYWEVSRLVDSKVSMSELPLEDRKRIAMGILYHAASPEQINQGFHETCGVNTIENKMFSEHPARAAALITRAALTSTFRTESGHIIDLPNQTLTAGPEEKVFPPSDGTRTQASKIFQSVVLNDIGQREGKRFITEEPQNGFEDFLDRITGKTGEYWVNDKGRSSFQGLTMVEMSDEAGRLMPGERTLIENAKRESAHSLRRLQQTENDLPFKKESDVADYLKSAKKQHQLPLILYVDAKSLYINPHGAEGLAESLDKNLLLEPALFPIMETSIFMNTVDSLIAPEPNHVITIRDYNDKNGEVYVNNSWGTKYNGWLKLTDLVKAT